MGKTYSGNEWYPTKKQLMEGLLSKGSHTHSRKRAVWEACPDCGGIAGMDDLTFCETCGGAGQILTTEKE